MANAKERPRARFAPIPIETTFERYRKTIPTCELTPSPSPRSPSPPPAREKRRFAPQLVESSVRRSRRAGDEGPATRPTDKTDITPYTNHIYAPKARKRFAATTTTDNDGSDSALQDDRPARRESCDDEIAGGVFDVAAREAQRKLHEVALAAFPNAGQRAGGAEHFFMREGSSDDDIPPRGRPRTRNNLHSRRNSSEEDLSWAFKEMQEHALKVQRQRTRDSSRFRSLDRIDSLELDKMSLGTPPSDAIHLTSRERTSIASSSDGWFSTRPPSSAAAGIGLGPIGESHMPLLRSDSPITGIRPIGESPMPYIPPPELPPIRPIGESHMPYIPAAPAGRAGDMPYVVPASRIPPETGFRNHAPYNPYYPPQERDMSLERAREQHRRRLKKSPPLLGEDLVFPRCPSPKQTKLDPRPLWDTGAQEEQNRDPTEKHGLWHGYCYSEDPSKHVAPAERPALISTPQPLGSPTDPFAREFGMSAPTLSEDEASSTISSGDGATRATTLNRPSSANGMSGHPPHPEHRTKNNEPKGLHMLQNLHSLDEKLRKEKEAAELEEKIAAEFDDRFVTQVYNYLSLGYPATARLYDEELSKISRIDIAELERDDEEIMNSLWGDGEGNGKQARGHIILDAEMDGVKEEDRCPRWKALKKYIWEWARQHPDLNAVSPLAWGVQERKGSWGL